MKVIIDLTEPINEKETESFDKVAFARGAVQRFGPVDLVLTYDFGEDVNSAKMYSAMLMSSSGRVRRVGFE